MANEKQGYLAYLVRLWRVRSAGRSVWRASLEDAHTGEQRGFADLETLFTFLKNKIQVNEALRNGQAATRGQARGGERLDSE